MNIYSIRDRVANDLVGNAMYILFCFRTDAQAVRYFSDAVLDEKSILNKHPNDYELIKLGELLDTNQSLDGFSEPQIIITGSALIAAMQEKPQLVQQNAS